MPIAHSGLDHIYFKALDTHEVRHELERLGFHPTSRDTSQDGDMTMVSAVFRNTWISIGALSVQTGASAEWMGMFRLGATPILLLRTEDNRAFVRDMSALGVTIPVDIMQIARPTMGPDGPLVLNFETSTGVGGPIPPPLFLAGMKQLTPERLFRRDLMRHANGVTDLVGFIIEIASVEVAAESLVRLFGEKEVSFAAGQATVDLGNAELVLCERMVLQARYGSMYRPEQTTFARFRVADLESSQHYLSPFAPAWLEQPKSLAIAVDSLNGCIFEFVE